MKKFYYILFFLPLPALAQGIISYIDAFKNLLNKTFPVVIGLAFLFFLWGLAKFILAAGNEDKIQEGRNIMFWGVIALFVMVSVWGIVAWLQVEFGITRYIPAGFP